MKFHEHSCYYDIERRQDTYPVVLKCSALETIDSYPSSWIHTFKGTINAGYGSVFFHIFQDVKHFRIHAGVDIHPVTDGVDPMN